MPDREPLPQLSAKRPFVTDGGLETTLIFHRGLVLPDFAAFVLLKDATGRQELHDYYLPYLELAREEGVGIVLDTPTWRANPDWASRLGYSPSELDQANRQAVALLDDIRAGRPPGGPPIVISGAIGPQGDG